MKRLLSAILLSVLLLSACAATPLAIDVTAAASLLRGAVSFDDIMSDLDTAAICRIFALTESEVVTAAGYVSTGATAEELFVLEMAEGKQSQVRTAVDAHMDYMIDGYSDYGPQEVPKLKNAVIETHGNYLFVCVCQDVGQAQTAIAQIVGK